ncbi:hypothetical protein O181_060311 [Austropuccinia psidii MF-1]|uniref:Uncharacterized protein n=1 Tax=Austropuccinia psidii MF-1 TaxID=1389203 RepID=A0A9Q3EKQ3_9BASI|nr:hypothetical protein [Austropuccinia psidii MF-1]
MHQIHIKNSPTTSFPKAPKGLPIDFYEVHWFNGKLPSQQRILADVGTIAFLRDASKSLDFTDEDEKMGDKRFTDKNWDEATKKYNLDFLVLPNDESDESRDSEDTDYGESIYLEFLDEDQNNSANEDEQKQSTPTKYSKGKHKSTEDNSQEYEMEIEDEYGGTHRRWVEYLAVN